MTICNLIQSHLEQLHGAVEDMENPDGSKTRACAYAHHSLQATTAAPLPDAGLDIRDIQDLLDRRHITTTRIYDKSRNSASCDVAI